jgi:cytochrome P450
MPVRDLALLHAAADQEPVGNFSVKSLGSMGKQGSQGYGPRVMQWPGVVQAVFAGLDPEGFFRWRAREGDPFSVRLPAVGEFLVTGSPEGARELFTADPAIFETMPANPVEGLLGPGSLLLKYGAVHTRERKLLSPAFHGERMRAYEEVIRDATAAQVARLQPGETFVVQEVARAVTLQVIVRAVFGVEEVREREQVAATVRNMLDAYTRLLMLLPALRVGPGPGTRFRKARVAFDAAMRAQIARRPAGENGRDDILSQLLGLRYEDGSGLSEDDLLDELRTLLVAGHDSTAGVLPWALYYLHAKDGTRAERARSDAAYLDAAVNEALRLHPVVPVVGRRLSAPLAFRGTIVPAGGLIALATPLLHTREDIFGEAPAEFRPERFLAGRKFTAFEFAPFGGGHRRCIGAAFAVFQLRTILATMLAARRFRLADPHARAPRPILRGIIAGANRAIRLQVC